MVESTLDNESRVIQALLVLPERAASELKPGEIDNYGVVRVGDEVLVDLMKSACGVTYSDAIKDALFFEVEGVSIPFASPQTLWRTKQTYRAKDVPDRLYLAQLLRAQGIQLGELEAKSPLARWWSRLKMWWHKHGSA